MLETKKCYCPYCGEIIELVLDLSMGEYQQYVEDCFVCCRPITLTIISNIELKQCELIVATEND